MNRSFTRHAAALAASSLLAVGTLVAHAQPAPAAGPAASSPAPLDFQQVIARVVALGYTDVREVEREGDKLYEVKARDAHGRRAELVVDARSGEVLHEKVKR